MYEEQHKSISRNLTCIRLHILYENITTYESTNTEAWKKKLTKSKSLIPKKKSSVVETYVKNISRRKLCQKSQLFIQSRQNR